MITQTYATGHGQRFRPQQLRHERPGPSVQLGRFQFTMKAPLRRGFRHNNGEKGR